MATLTLTVNGKVESLELADPTTPLLWVLRDQLGLTGTKYGCGRGLCGSCTVHLNGIAVRSCQMPAVAMMGQNITTIEGLAGREETLTPLQQAWIDEDVAQCGYCQAGQIMSAASLLRVNPAPTDEAIDAALAGNLCRCATYQRIRKAIHIAASKGAPVAV
jgi:isoquinoline 1-oxidoreductase subunit alpha